MKRVKDIPQDERPREKLVKKGPQSLSDVELIAILLGRGIEGHDVMSVANQVLIAIDSNGGRPIVRRCRISPAWDRPRPPLWPLPLNSPEEESNRKDLK